jgi:hypothetical protein
MNDTDPVPETPVGPPPVVVDPVAPAVAKPVPKPSPEGTSEFWKLRRRFPENMWRTMPEYRICYVTPDDRIAVAPVRFVRENDHAAVQYAQSLRDRNCYQLWQGRRLVARLKPTQAA